MPPPRLLALALTLTALGAGCDDGASTADGMRDGIADTMADAIPDISPHGIDGTDDTPDGTPPDAPPDAGALDARPPDASTPDALTPDAGPPPRCSAPPPAPPAPDGPLPPPVSAHRGVDPLEAPAWHRLRDRLMAEPGVHFVATYAHARDAFVITGGPPEARAEVVFSRVDHADRTAYEVIEGDLAAIFPDTDPTRHGDYPALLAAMGNPDGVEIPERGYAADDPRVGWLPLDAQSWPDPLVRLATLFSAPDAPDAVVGTWPWANGGTGSHGGLGLLQSRAAFVLSGRGARRGVVIDTPARLVDAAPTALAALAVPTTDGVGPDGTYPGGLYLARQDGAVRWEGLDPDPCVRARHVVMILFDGLLAPELNHLMLADAPPIELPTFRALAAEGAVYRHGAVVGFPSMSAPGHATAGTGAWPGHHGVVGNAFHGRAEAEVINPFAVLSDLPAYLSEPARLYALYDRILSGDVETLAEATHRALGADAFVAVLNELTIGGADYTPLDFFGIDKASLGDTERVDILGELMVRRVLGDPARPVPDVLQISFLATDAAGESDGPHSDLVRSTLATLDRRVATIRDAYARRGALDDTLFILVSDHGMELQDPTRTAALSAAVRDSGVRTRYVGSGGIWLAQLALAVEDRGPAGITVRVTAHDDGRPVEGARVACDGCAEAFTDADGRATVMPAEGAALTASHPAFNPVGVGP